MFKPSRILVPTDMSDHSTRSLRHALDIARQYNSKVYLLHVIQNPVQQYSADYYIDDRLMNQLQAEMFENVQHGIRKQLALFPSIDPDSVSIEIKTGTPHAEIFQEAEAKDIDLIVIAFLGSSGLARYLMGGVARHVLQEAKCPVLLIK